MRCDNGAFAEGSRRYRHGMASSVLPCQTASRRMDVSVGTGCATTRASKNACRAPWVEREVGACASTSSPATMGWGKGSCWTPPRGRWPSWLRLSRGALMAPGHRFTPSVGSPPGAPFPGLPGARNPRRNRGCRRFAGRWRLGRRGKAMPRQSLACPPIRLELVMRTAILRLSHEV